ncbi:MAG: hypothetical protein JST54_07705 [Deltaproteobacteria bacterium]|nr:hypothetical protein [Deltaproteobacteria bacterium]
MARTFRLGLTLIAGIALAGCFGAKSDSASGSSTGSSQGTTAHGSSGANTTANTNGGSGASTTGTNGTSATTSVNTVGTSGTSSATSDIGTTGVSATSTGTSGTSSATSDIGTTGVSATSTGTNGFSSTTTNGTSGFSTTTSGTSSTTSGTTGHGNASSSTATSTTGTFSTTTGTTGVSVSSTTGTSGTTGTGDCRSGGCGYGESCTALPSSAGTIWSCTCSQGNGQTGSDSCSGNPDGNTVCDPNSLQCSKPTDYGACTPGTGTNPCAAGYTCVAYPGGGYCLQGCSTTDQCNLSYAQCQQGYCQVDSCGPNDFGVPQNGNFYGPCNLADAGDGYCQPFGDGQGGLIGYCMGTGSAQNGDPCPGFGVKGSSECAAGEVCYSLGLHYRDGGAANECFTDCDANQPNQCPGNSACFPYDSHATTSPDPGYCFPP